MTSISTGSIDLAVDVFVRISGLPTASSKPSRRIISMRMASCSSPRPITLNVSGVSDATRIETFVSSSLSSRSRRFREVTNCPSLPAKGDVLTVNVMPMVGSSIWIGGIGLGVSTLVIVSPIVMPSTPAMASRSPGLAIVSSMRFRPSNE